MDSNIKRSIKIVVDNKIIGLVKSLGLTEEFIWESFGSASWEVPIGRKLKESYIIGEFQLLTFNKKLCKPFPRFFNIQFYENDKLINTIEDIYLTSLINQKQSDLDNFFFESDFINETVIGWNTVEFSNRNAKEYKDYYNEQNKSKQIFTDEFTKKLDLGKYTSWVNKLSPEQLQGLFWAIGELKVRIGSSLDECSINRLLYGLDPDKLTGSNERAITGFKLLLEFISGKERTLDEVQKEIRESV